MNPELRGTFEKLWVPRHCCIWAFLYPLCLPDHLSGKRKRKLQNVTIKVDPLQIVAIKKLSNMKSIPYQTLIRHWLAEGIKHEMDSVLK